jgi:transposase
MATGAGGQGAMREPARLELTAEQREKLRAWASGQRVEHRLHMRSAIILRLAEGVTAARVAEDLGVSRKMVKKWRSRFRAEGPEGLHDAPRSGRPPRFSVSQRYEVIALACDSPGNYGHAEAPLWTYDLLTEVAAREVEGPAMSRSSIQRTLAAHVLHPHHVRGWLHSKDPEFKEKVNEVVSLYLEPPPDAVVVCVDEDSGLQALERKYETRQPQPGRPGRYEYEYQRHGTVSVLAALNVATGDVIASCGPTRTAGDLVAFMEQVAAQHQEAKAIHVIWDNLNIHYDGKDERWTNFNAAHGGKFTFHYTPIHASWVNQVEIFFSILQRKVLRHGSFASAQELIDRIMAFVARWNGGEGHPFHWTFRGYPMQKEAV